MKKLTFNQIAGLIIIIFSITALYASLTLSIEYLEVIKNPSIALACNINSAINCTSVMNSWQAQILGFPNTYIGLIGYGASLTLGFVLLFQKQIGRWLNLFALLGSFGAFVFSYWLLWQSAFAIGALCIYCLISCFSATNIFFALKLVTLKENSFSLNENFNVFYQKFINKGYYWIVFAIWYLIIVGVLLLEFNEAILGMVA